MRFDGILFDLDGTLWDSCLSVAESWRNTLYTRYGVQHLPSVEDIQSIMGLPTSEVARRLFTGYGAPAQEVCSTCMRDECRYLGGTGSAFYRKQLPGRLYPKLSDMVCPGRAVSGF